MTLASVDASGDQPAFGMHPRISDDGTKVLFRGRDTTNRLFYRDLTAGTTIDATPAFSASTDAEIDLSGDGTAVGSRDITSTTVTLYVAEPDVAEPDTRLATWSVAPGDPPSQGGTSVAMSGNGMFVGYGALDRSASDWWGWYVRGSLADPDPDPPETTTTTTTPSSDPAACQ